MNIIVTNESLLLFIPMSLFSPFAITFDYINYQVYFKSKSYYRKDSLLK